MKRNSGITIITLVITIIVIILIASITIYSGVNTLKSVQVKNAKDAANSISLALSAQEEHIPSGLADGSVFSEVDAISGRELTNEDFELLGLDYKTDTCKVVVDKYLEGENTVVYRISYTDDLGNTYPDNTYKYYKELTKTTTKSGFDTVKKVNRPLLSKEGMVALDYSGNTVKNVYTENWYNYEKGISKLASMQYNGNTYVWIPRFAYKIQNFYIGKTYDNIPTTAIDIVFLRDASSLMSNGEVLQPDYEVHPAFTNGETGFWIMTGSEGTTNSIANAINACKDVKDANGVLISHLMKNSEYAAAIFLMRCLGNEEITFSDKEFVGAVCDEHVDNFDVYSSNNLDTNYIMNIQGQGLSDTPWNLKKTPTVPTGVGYLMRDVTSGGEFYYEFSTGITQAVFRRVIAEQS